MIFRSVTKVRDKIEKKFFQEKVVIYTRLVQVFVEKFSYNIDILSFDKDEDLINHLIEIGVIDNCNELKDLYSFLGEKIYTDFLSSVNFHIQHKEQMGSMLDNLNNTRRKERQKTAILCNKPKIIDFFCGAGGLSLGFIQEGFIAKLANDNEEVCCETYKYNHPETPSDKVIEGDIRKIVNHIEDYIIDEIDVVVGGPPCQGFSSANKQPIIDDPRNELYKYYVKAIEKIAPKFVVMENVRGMLSVANQVIEDFRKLKITKGANTFTYDISFRLLNSQDFSVAQSRTRLIFLAIRNDVAEKNNITPEKIYREIEESCKANPIYVLKEALDFIKPLESPRIKNLNEVDDERTGKKIDINTFTGKENNYLRLINQDREMFFLFNHKARYASDINYKIFERLNQGEDATDSKIADIMPYARRNHCFKDKYFKLVADKPCRTITAHLRMDCLSHIHPLQIRTITPREAARVQSFPDDYLFLGAYLKTYMQIGNAVPPLMARGIARIVKKYIK